MGSAAPDSTRSGRHQSTADLSCGVGRGTVFMQQVQRALNTVGNFSSVGNYCSSRRSPERTVWRRQIAKEWTRTFFVVFQPNYLHGIVPILASEFVESPLELKILYLDKKKNVDLKKGCNQLLKYLYKFIKKKSHLIR